MSLFTFEAIDSRGRKKQGEIEASSERAARQQLKERGFLPRSLSMVENVRDKASGRASYALGTTEAVTFLQQLAILLEAGMPLTDALGSIAEGMESRKAMRTVAALRQQVLEGIALAQALREQGFDDVICNMVEAGEETGQLDAVAGRLAELLEQRQHLRQELFSATLYPAIITGFGLLVMVFLLTVVVPQVVGVFERAGGDLPWLTQALITVSDGLRAHGLLLILTVAVLMMAYHVSMRRHAPRVWRDHLLLRLPGIGTVLRKIETAKFARTLGMLLSGGVPVLSAMHIAVQGLSLIPIREVVLAAKESLREGESLAKCLAQGAYIPHLAVRLIAVGEQSGKLDSMLLRVAESYEEESSRNLKRLVTILEPVLVLLMALLVGTLAMAILLPIMEMNQLVR
ncbi:MAG: type II secretion system F family protein [Mariprofundaceae bacterium]